MSAGRIERMRGLLEAALQPAGLEIRDDSALHAGHAGAASGAGHFAVRIVSQLFEGLRPLQRHRLVYDALGAMLPDEIHALAIEASTPAETAPAHAQIPTL